MDPTLSLCPKTRSDLGWDALLEALAARAHTDRGAQAARLITPLATADDAHAHQAEVSEARSLADQNEALPFGGIRDVRVPLERAHKGGLLLPQELLDVARTLQGGARLRRHLAARAAQAPRLLGRASLIAELAEVFGPIEDALDDQAGLKDSASPALRGLRQRVLSLQEDLSRRADALVDQSHIAPYLQDRFVTQREERYVLPVRVDSRSRVKGIVHGTSSSGATVFVEPEEIIDLNNRLKLAQLEVAEEERRILLDLSMRVQGAVPRIYQNLEVLAQLDVVDCAARLSADLRCTPVALHPATGPEATGVDLRKGRHPLLLLKGVQVIPNDVRVTPGGTLVVSGPNAGGKTVALKMLGLCALMARSGLHCPVQEGSSLPLFDQVLTDVGDDQSLDRDLSTFSAHILNLCGFIRQASPTTLILLDEVAAGTDPEQGAALAQAVLEAFSQAHATVVVTTHYDRLKALAPKNPRFINASVGYDLDKLVPTYQLHQGVPGASGAVLVARRLGLPEGIANRANELLGHSKTGVEELLQTLLREREGLLRERAQLEHSRAQTERDMHAAQELRAEAQRELQKARRHAHDDAIVVLRRARQELEDVRGALKKAPETGKEEVGKVKKRVDQLAREVAGAAPEPVMPPGRPARAEELSVGTKVLVVRLGALGAVLSEPIKDKAVVQVGGLKMTVEVGDLRIPTGGGAPPSDRSSSLASAGRRGRHEPAATVTPAEPARGRVRTDGATLDLRGERMEVALARAEKFVDTAMQEGLSAVWLIHGHGTGVLRTAIRQHFTRFPGVTRLFPAEQNDGGDGVTVIEME